MGKLAEIVRHPDELIPLVRWIKASVLLPFCDGARGDACDSL